MKQFLFIPFAAFTLAVTSCNSQRLVAKVNDAKKLETNKDNFIGKPLKKVLSEIEPEIKFVYGNPENNWGGAFGGTYFVFNFDDKEEKIKRLSAKDTPTRIVVQFELEPKNVRKPLPKDGLTKWSKKETKAYGDMIVLNIRVTGEN